MLLQDLAPWDVPYFTGQARQSKFSMSGGDLAPYFSLGAVMDGLSSLLQNLYNVSLKVQEPLPGELWTNDVYKLAGG